MHENSQTTIIALNNLEILSDNEVEQSPRFKLENRDNKIGTLTAMTLAKCSEYKTTRN